MAHPNNHPQYNHTQWPALIFLLVTGVLAAAQLGKVPQALLKLSEALTMSLTFSGWAVSLITLVATVLGGAAGLIVESLGLRRVILAGMVLIAGAGIAEAWVWDRYLFLLLRALEGIGYLAIVVAAPVLIARFSYGSARALALALWAGFVMAGFALIAAMFAGLQQSFDWRGIFTISALLMALLAALGVYLLPSLDHSTRAAKALNISAFFKNQQRAYRERIALLISIGFGLYAIASIAFMAFLPTYLEQYWQLPPSTVFSLATSVPLIAVVGNISAGFMFRAGAPCLPSALLSYSAMLLSALAMYGFDNFAISVSAAFIYAFFNGIASSALFALVPILLSSQGKEALGFGLIAQFGSLGALLGPPLGGWALQYGGWVTFAAVLFLSLLAGLLCLLALLYPKRDL